MTEHHDLKCWPEPFAALRDGTKTFEYRRDDRGFAVGDVLRIREWLPTATATGRGDYRRATPGGAPCEPLLFRVTYVLHGGRFGVPEGFVVMGIKRGEHD